MDKQIDLIVQWMRVDLSQVNTDNMTISGETIDYGPCAFMDHFDTNTVFSSTIINRYAYSNQAPIAQWNLARLAESLLTHSSETDTAVDMAKECISSFAINMKKPV